MEMLDRILERHRAATIPAASVTAHIPFPEEKREALPEPVEVKPKVKAVRKAAPKEEE